MWKAARKSPGSGRGFSLVAVVSRWRAHPLPSGDRYYKGMPHPLSFAAGPVQVGGPSLFLIAGPCVLESEDHARMLAGHLQRLTADLKVPYIFKASFDKANRTSLTSFRGLGLAEGCRILRRLGQDTGLPVLTDIHIPEQAAEVSDRLGPVEAILQIPAFLCRQTDLLVAAARTGRAVNVKKGQFVSPWDMRHAVEKVSQTQMSLPDGSYGVRVCLTERGASFGYNNLVVDMRALPVMRQLAPVIFDATHSVQTPSSVDGRSGGQPEFISVLARAAAAAGVDGIFLEVHEKPTEAKSDGANALPLDALQPLLERLLAVREAVGSAF